MFGFTKKKPTKSSMPTFAPLRFHNTLSGEVELFVPLSPGTVKMYNCGPTVYDKVHIGNLRSYTLADTLGRVFRTWGFEVKQVINITDFGHLTSDADEGDDKMSKGLAREGLTLTLENMRTLADKYTQYFFDDLDLMGIKRDVITFPRASDYIPEQIALIQTLEQKSYAYETPDGVYYDVSRFPSYGKLGNINLAGLQAGARVEHNTNKRGPFDFILWKSDKKIGWESPWGLGFPGWHIECTAMIFKLLGKQIDVHTGGIDHIPVHHNNEIAQAEAATGKKFVGYWLHNEFITIDAKRIGKSVGNMIHLQGVVDRGFSPKALRYWFLTGHYRSPMNFTWDVIEGANTSLQRLTRVFFEELGKAEQGGEPDSAFIKDFTDALANDLDTAKALARMWELVKDDSVSPAAKRASLVFADSILGLGFTEAGAAKKIAVIEKSDLPLEVQTLMTERAAARASKDFALSDELRSKIETLGYEVKDTGTDSQITRK